MADKLVEIFKSFLSGNQDSYWEFICNERVQKVIDYQISITRSKFKLSKEEVDDFRNEMFISLDRRLRAYVFDPAKVIKNVLGNTFGKILISCSFIEIFKRKYNNGLFLILQISIRFLQRPIEKKFEHKRG